MGFHCAELHASHAALVRRLSVCSREGPLLEVDQQSTCLIPPLLLPSEPPAGTLRVHVASWTAGRCAGPTAPMPSRVLASPSLVCHRVCKAAEFFRYAVQGTMMSPSEWH